MLLLCFSLYKEYYNSFLNVEDLWFKELSRQCPRTPIILLGTKADLREDPAELERLKKEGVPVVTEELVIDCYPQA